MATIIKHVQPAPKTGNAALDYAIGLIGRILTALLGLVSLDDSVRAERSEVAERAVLFASATVVGTAVTAMEVIAPDVITKTFTTALIMFDTSSGSGRFRYDGQNPLTAAAAASGLPIPSGGFQIVITGQLNIRSFRVIGEPAQTLNMSVMLHQ